MHPNHSIAMSPKPATSSPLPANTLDPAESLFRLAEADEVDEPPAVEEV